MTSEMWGSHHIEGVNCGYHLYETESVISPVIMVSVVRAKKSLRLMEVAKCCPIIKIYVLCFKADVFLHTNARTYESY